MRSIAKKAKEKEALYKACKGIKEHAWISLRSCEGEKTGL
jgi:hypothetical protein